MSRYTDLDKIIEFIKTDMVVKYPSRFANGILAVAREINFLPTCDVVPRSECEKWYAEYHKVKEDLKREKMYQRESAKLADKYFAELKQAKQEVASKIIREIREAIFAHGTKYAMKKLVSIENKYMNGE